MIELVKKESTKVVQCDSDDGNEMDKRDEIKEKLTDHNDVILIGDLGRMNESPRPMIEEKEEIREDETANEGREVSIPSRTRSNIYF